MFPSQKQIWGPRYAQGWSYLKNMLDTKSEIPSAFSGPKERRNPRNPIDCDGLEPAQTVTFDGTRNGRKI